MILRLSRFVHLVKLPRGRALLIHALRDHRLTVDGEVMQVIVFFDLPRRMPDAMAELLTLVPYDQPTMLNFLVQLMDQGILTDLSPEAESEAARERLGAADRDPLDLLERYQRSVKRGTHPYWSVARAKGIGDLAAGAGKTIPLILMGDCELQMEAEFLTKAAAERGLTLEIAATFPDDARLAAERAHQAILIGALRTRGALLQPMASADINDDPYLVEARRTLLALRAVTTAPILIDTLPEPTVMPFGLADQHGFGHRNRVRRINLALIDLADSMEDVFIVDIAAALAQAGSARLVDDGLFGYVHFGSPGWLLQRPDSERAAVHGVFPELDPLISLVDGDPYLRERVTAAAHLDALTTILAIERKKCILVDLDGTLWPGVLAETGAPFAWTPEVSGLYSFIGLYIGIQEALKLLRRRGIVLACVSKNDEATVRALWRYEDHYPKDRLLSLDDFSTYRINWTDKATNIAEIIAELGFAPETFLFLDDNPIERERVKQAFPQIETLGEDLFAVRRRLLTDPRLMVPRITEESARRGDLVKAQIARDRARSALGDEAAFLESLEIETRISAPQSPAEIARIAELFQRTTQFNTNGFKPTGADLIDLAQGNERGLLALHLRDRFGDHGLVGAVAFEGQRILGFVLSCRVIGLKVEFRLLEAALGEMARWSRHATAEIIPTSRNHPARHLYRDAGFTLQDGGHWRKDLGDGP